jgi:hypothetical protein
MGLVPVTTRRLSKYVEKLCGDISAGPFFFNLYIEKGKDK